MAPPAGSSIIVQLPWPPAILFPNARRASHWRKSRGIAKAYRQECWALARVAIGRIRFSTPPGVSVAFFPPDARRRDDDGMIGAFKNGRDGVADAIGLDDATWRPSYSFHDPLRPDGRVVVVLTVRPDP